MANQFRDKTMRKEYDAAVFAWTAKHCNLFRPDGSIKRGSSFAEFFWNGFNKTGRQDFDARSRKMLGYAYFRAGQDCAKVESLTTLSDAPVTHSKISNKKVSIDED